MRPNLTANFGLRYELQMPFTAKNDSYSTATLASLCGLSGVASGGGCNLFQAGTMPGQRPEFVNLGEGQSVYDTDRNNWAPNVGFNWTPSAEGGFLGSMLGQEGDSVDQRRLYDEASTGTGCRTSRTSSARIRASRSP